MSSTYPRRIVASTVWSFRFTYRAAPVLMGCTAVFTLLLGLVPSAQVLLIERLAVSVDHGPRKQAYVWALLTGLLTAGYLAAEHVMYALQRMTQIVATAAARVQIAESYASLDPVEIVDQEVQSTARAAREAVNEKEVALQATSGLSLVFSLVVVVSLAITIGRNSWLSALFTIGCLVPLSLSAMWYARQDLVAWPKINEARRHAAYREDQLVYPSRSVELACMDARGWLTERIAALHRVSRDNEIWLEKQGVRSDALSGLACAVLLVCALLALLVDGVSGAGVTAGAIGITSGIMATANVGFVVSRLLSGANAVDRYRAFVEREPFAHDDADHERHGVSVLRADGLTIRYPNAAAPSLVDASICARRGEIIAIVGSNGAGKTTLINALLGLVSVESGRIWFDDIDVTEGGFAQRHQGVALMPQDFGRYEFTVRENLALAAPEKVEDDFHVWEALQRCKIDGVIDSLPGGLDAQLGDQWGGTSLSGGQWQRLALARMVLRDSPVWILDEPTSAIDAEAEEQIFRELRESAQDHIVIVVSHRAWTLRYTDRIYVLDHGRVVEEGSYDDLRCGNGRFAQLFRLQNVTDAQEEDVR